MMFMHSASFLLAVTSLLALSASAQRRCVDDPDFFFTYVRRGVRHSQNCKYFTSGTQQQNKMRRLRFCFKTEIARSCNKSCNPGCEPPTPPNEPCEDSKTFSWKFTDRTGKTFTHRCSFLTNGTPERNEIRKNNWCGPNSQNKNVKNECRKSCDNCPPPNNDPCVNRDNFRWFVNNQRRECSFITNQNRRHANCNLKSRNGTLVKVGCRKNCKNCKNDSDMMAEE